MSIGSGTLYHKVFNYQQQKALLVGRIETSQGDIMMNLGSMGHNFETIYARIMMRTDR